MKKLQSLYCRKPRLQFLLTAIIVLLTGAVEITHAQTFTFSVSIIMSGTDCAGIATYSASAPASGVDKSLCEQLCSQVEALSFSTPSCSVTYQCNCIQTSGSSETGPTDFSYNNAASGEPLATNHASASWEDWSKDIIQQLESFGQEAKNIKSSGTPPIPKSGNKEVDQNYNHDSEYWDPNVVDLRHLGEDDPGVVQSLKGPLPDQEAVTQYKNALKDQGYENLISMDETNPEIKEPLISDQTQKNLSELRDLVYDIACDDIIDEFISLYPQLKLPLLYLGFGTELVQQTISNIQTALNTLNGTGSGNYKSPTELVAHSMANSNAASKWALEPLNYPSNE